MKFNQLVESQSVRNGYTYTIIRGDISRYPTILLLVGLISLAVGGFLIYLEFSVVFLLLISLGLLLTIAALISIVKFFRCRRLNVSDTLIEARIVDIIEDVYILNSRIIGPEQQKLLVTLELITDDTLDIGSILQLELKQTSSLNKRNYMTFTVI